jgi:hypothetical protein
MVAGRGTHRRIARAIEMACVFFALLGLAVALGGRTALFETWNRAAGLALFAGLGGEMPADAVAFQRFVVGPIGATFAAHFVMLAYVARRARRERWALAAFASSVLTWFVIDSACSFARGAAFNVAMVNAPCLVLLAVPWAFAARDVVGAEE